MSLLVAILSGFVMALFAPGLYRIARGATGWILSLVPLALAGYFIFLIPTILSEGRVLEGYAWAPSLGIDLTFHLDGLSLLFALLITVVGALIFIYAGGYLAGHPQLGRLYAFLLMFLASMLGLVLADNLLALFLFWELTSIASYLLIGFDHERAEARAAALQALLITGGGGLALLAGFLLLGQAGGSLETTALLGQASAVHAHALYVPALVLILLGAFTKSAQFPFHFWLPGAMQAPTPVSAYLHSATMVKAGVYLLARLNPVLGGTDLWFWTLTLVGGTTMLSGAWLALLQSDLKRILAYSTVSALGTLVLLLGQGDPVVAQAAMAFLLGHALYKGALFLVAGTLDHETGTRNVDRLGGLLRAMPFTALAAGLAALSMAGLPPLFGFISKELTYEASLQGRGGALGIAAAVIANGLLVGVAALVGIRPFLGKATETPRKPHEAPVSLWLGALTLSSLSLLFGLAPFLAADLLVSRASAAVFQDAPEIHLALWHGLTPALYLSGVTLVVGVMAFLARGFLRKAASRWTRFAKWGPAQGYELALRGVNGIAALQTRVLQSGNLRHYLLIVLAALVALTGMTLLTRCTLVEPGRWGDLHFYEAGLAVLILAAILATVLARSRLAAIAALGVVGYCVALVFVLFGAPDVAMTQFLVETLTVILFVLVFYHLREAPMLTTPASRLRDILLAAGVGVLMTALVLISTDTQYHPSISEYYREHGVEWAHGRNLVNVILVDFRGLDTLGEITVLAVAAVGVVALLKLRLGGDRAGESGKPTAADPNPTSIASSNGKPAEEAEVANDGNAVGRTTS